MPADDVGERRPSAALLGFKSYADDTPRPLEFDPWGADDFEREGDLRRPGDHAGFEAPRRRRAAWPALAAFCALAVGVAAGVALTERGVIGNSPPATQAPAAPETTVDATPQLRVEVGPETAADVPSPPSRAPRMQVLPEAPAILPPDRPSRRDEPPAGQTIARLNPPPPAKIAAPTAAAITAPSSAPAQAQVAPSPARVEPSFDCRSARSYGRQMVCGDPELAAADRRMTRAFAAAIAAGASRDNVQADQDDWEVIREDAARHSRHAVANIYAQRIEELEALAKQRPE
ncbi:MAG TPA: hypothetical protein VGH86_17625 [Phenylobacterium sp.]|jgi:uncharacterized protein YecT (DUF1311 family)